MGTGGAPTLVDELRNHDRSGPESQPDSDQADFLVTPADGSEQKGDEGEEQQDHSQGQVPETSVDQQRKHPQGQADRDEVRLLPTPTDRGDDKNDQSNDLQNLSQGHERYCRLVSGDLTAELNLVGNALQPGAQRSWWLREALAHETGPDCPPLKE